MLRQRREGHHHLSVSGRAARRRQSVSRLLAEYAVRQTGMVGLCDLVDTSYGRTRPEGSMFGGSLETLLRLSLFLLQRFFLLLPASTTTYGPPPNWACNPSFQQRFAGGHGVVVVGIYLNRRCHLFTCSRIVVALCCDEMLIFPHSRPHGTIAGTLNAARRCSRTSPGLSATTSFLRFPKIYSKGLELWKSCKLVSDFDVVGWLCCPRHLRAVCVEGTRRCR